MYSVVSERDLLLGELSRVLLGDAESVEFAELLLLDSLDLPPLLVDLLPDLAALLQVVQSVLLRLVVVLLDLRPKLVRVLLQHSLLLLLNSLLLFLDLLLFFYNAEEFIPFLFGLFGKAGLPLEELPLSRVLQVPEHLLLVLEVPPLLLSRLSLALFERALRPQRVDLSLSIGSLLLELPKSSDLALLLLLHALELRSLLLLSLCLGLVVVNNLLLKVLFLLLALVLDLYGPLVGLLDLAHHTEGTVLLGCEDSVLLLLDLFGLTDHLLHLPLTHLLLLDAFEFSFLDLINNDERALLLCVLALDLPLLLELERLESLDLHHEIQALLFADPLLLEPLRLLELSVSDRDDLGVKHHLVHVLHVVVVLVEHLLRLSEETLSLFLIDDLLLSGWHLCCSFFVQVKHTLLPCLGSSHG